MIVDDLDIEECGVTYDHVMPDGYTECRVCGADLSAWADGEDES